MKNYLILCILLMSGTAIIAQSRNISFARAAKDSVWANMNKTGAPGMAITVSVNGIKVWSEGFGYADLEQHVPVNAAKTKFRIASISKSLTATVLAMLYEKGSIQLDSSIYYYLPDYPTKPYRPTIQQLAGHLGGIRHYRGEEMFISRPYTTVREALTIFQQDSLLHKPGTKYEYSSYGFNLLSAAMEMASGKDFLTLMNESLFKPYKMHSTQPDMNDSLIDSRCRYYVINNRKAKNAPFVNLSYKWAGGGFLSTSEDLVRFGNLYLRPDFLRKETIALFTTSQVLTDGKPTGYGIGWDSQRDKKGRFVFGHRGGAVGGTSNLRIYPKEKLVIAVLTNCSGASLDPLVDALAEIFLNR